MPRHHYNLTRRYEEIDVDNSIDFTPQGERIKESRCNPLLIYIMNKIWHWIVDSSANPENVSLTVKGILLQYVSVIVLALTMFHLKVTEGSVTYEIGKYVAYLGVFLSLVGMIRKIYYALK